MERRWDINKIMEKVCLGSILWLSEGTAQAEVWTILILIMSSDLTPVQLSDVFCASFTALLTVTCPRLLFVLIISVEVKLTNHISPDMTLLLILQMIFIIHPFSVAANPAVRVAGVPEPTPAVLG